MIENKSALFEYLAFQPSHFEAHVFESEKADYKVKQRATKTDSFSIIAVKVIEMCLTRNSFGTEVLNEKISGVFAA